MRLIPYAIRTLRFCGFISLGLSLNSLPTLGGVNVVLTGVPDYEWDAGCFGTASGNLMGYWDRHGFPNFYTGPTAGGVAPLTSGGANVGIRSLWASRAGLDGRSSTNYGHMDDYWVVYESPDQDPYVTAGRPEHTPDCIGDFIGLSQKKWSDLNGECDGNIDAFSFVFWDENGDRRSNFMMDHPAGSAIPDIASGLKAWTKFRGYDAETFSQLADFNPKVPTGHGFTFEDLKAEIDAGYPVLLFLQKYDEFSRTFDGMPRANPHMHGMLAYGYYISDSGDQRVRYRTSWGSGDNVLSLWNSAPWQAELPVRGVIGYHPRPQITQITPAGNSLVVEWQGPSGSLSNVTTRVSTPLHRYVLEKATQLNPPNFQPVGEPTGDTRAVVADCCGTNSVFFRLELLPAPTLE